MNNAEKGERSVSQRIPCSFAVKYRYFNSNENIKSKDQ